MVALGTLHHVVRKPKQHSMWRSPGGKTLKLQTHKSQKKMKVNNKLLFSLTTCNILHVVNLFLKSYCYFYHIYKIMDIIYMNSTNNCVHNPSLKNRTSEIQRTLFLSHNIFYSLIPKVFNVLKFVFNHYLLFRKVSKVLYVSLCNIWLLFSDFILYISVIIYYASSVTYFPQSIWHLSIFICAAIFYLYYNFVL